MKKIVLLFALIFTIVTSAQRTVRAAIVKIDHLTTTQRDSYVVPSNQTWKIYNVTTGRKEINVGGAGWVADPGGTDGGADGIDGKSAYQLAVDEGYTGTLAQWLTSLEGADGAQGIQGVAGNDGADGAQGIPGVKGDKGDQGIQGPQGPAGNDGADGAQGIQGIQGVTGNDGADGADGADGIGVPTGGTTGQLLAKKTNADNDTEWVDAQAGSGSYTDENAQDAVGGMVANSSTINLTYTDATPSILANVVSGSLDGVHFTAAINAILAKANTALQPDQNINFSQQGAKIDFADDGYIEGVRSIKMRQIGSSNLFDWEIKSTQGEFEIDALGSSAPSLFHDGTNSGKWSIGNDAILTEADVPTHVRNITTQNITDWDGKEDALGNPSANGQVLASQADGTRSWVSPTGDFGIVASGTATLPTSGTTLITHGLGYAPNASRISITKTNPSSSLDPVQLISISTTTIGVTTNSSGGETVAWRIFGANAATPLDGTEVVSLIDTELGQTTWKGGGSSTDDQTGAEVLLTGYTKPSTTSAIAATDNVNEAIGKLEKGLESVATGGNLLEVTENGNTGYRISRANSAYTGNIGVGALDLGVYYSNQTDAGAKGAFSSILSGQGGTTLGDFSVIVGSGSSKAFSFGEVVTGYNSTDYVAGSTSGWVPTDRIFTIGNGGNDVKSDALIILKNGTITAPSLNNALITTAGNKALITKEYADANYLGGGSETAASIKTKYESNADTNSFTDAREAQVVANTGKVGITTTQATDITANNAKVSNVTHTGDVAGATTLTITNGAVTDSKIASGVNSNKIGSGNVSNTEFNMLNGVTSNIQNQIDALEEITPATITTSRNVVASDADGVNFVTGTTTLSVATNAVESIPINTGIVFINDGTDVVTIDFLSGVAGTDVVLSKNGHSVTILKTGTDTWKVINAPRTILEPFTSTGTAISLNGQGYYNTVNSATTYTTTDSVTGGFARVLINTTSEPAVTGATKITGADWVTGTDMFMVVSYNGTSTEYYFLEK